MDSLPECLRNKIWNYAAQMMLAERNKKWDPINDEYMRTMCYHITPYLVLDPEVLSYTYLRPGPFKHIVDSVLIDDIIEEQCPWDQ